MIFCQFTQRYECFCTCILMGLCGPGVHWNDCSVSACIISHHEMTNNKYIIFSHMLLVEYEYERKTPTDDITRNTRSYRPVRFILISTYCRYYCVCLSSLPALSVIEFPCSTILLGDTSHNNLAKAHHRCTRHTHVQESSDIRSIGQKWIPAIPTN